MMKGMRIRRSPHTLKLGELGGLFLNMVCSSTGAMMLGEFAPKCEPLLELWLSGCGDIGRGDQHLGCCQYGLAVVRMRRQLFCAALYRLIPMCRNFYKMESTYLRSDACIVVCLLSFNLCWYLYLRFEILFPM